MRSTLSISHPWLVIVALVMLAVTPAVLEAQAGRAPEAACSATSRRSSPRPDSLPDLAGIWDFKIDMGSVVATGTMALGHMDGAYAGALTPDATNTVAIRKFTLTGDSVQMSVASREGEVRVDGRLTGADDVLCGIVTYHGGVKYPIAAIHRKRVRPG